MTNIALSGALASFSSQGVALPASPAASAQGTAWSGATGVTFPASGSNMLWCWNGSGSAITATVAFAKTVEGQSVTALTPSLLAGQWTELGPYSPSDFNSPATGLMTITFSSVTSLYVALFQCNPVQ
jgi:hypothetical protein